jgi:putative transposon-encoded protein
MGNSGGIYLPKEWIGKQVKVLLVDPLEKSLENTN